MRRVRRKGGNKEKVFGCDLLEHLTTSGQEVPHVLRCCSEFVEHHGIVDGIYRLSGVSSNIQKLRGEFENDGTPDLNKDVYLQDIHCVSSLCKAYFRELPNPLLTYQLYDKFAEAVGIQLEEERLVKIGDVLKDLPQPHYRTLEFLMRHLVRMASYSSETNMHARNLAIVWAPNLLRSKDIEATGFNGTAAFMEVRVQSIVVEFILTHVPQLFPDEGLSKERRKSLPSPSAFPKQEEILFTPVPTPAVSYGNISPGDGPLPIRPYHAIIEGTDKRKGSLKGRKWMSIFNIGGRFPDPRRRHKPSAKVSEKERPALRPARSMDSLSSPSYPNDGTRLCGQRPPSTNLSPLVTATPQPGSDVAVSAGALGGSEYAVTYRRGTGLVSGSAGVQGTYTALDPEGLGLASNDTVQSRSPGISTKAGRRAAMHITGPTIVTVPLHITSNLALGVLQRGGADRIIHRGRDKNGGDKVESKVGEEKGNRVMEWNVEEDKKVEEEVKSHKEKSSEEDVDMGENTVAAGGAEDKTGEEAGEEGGDYERQRAKSQSSNSEEDPKKEANDAEQAVEENDYIDMKGGEGDSLQPEGTEHQDNGELDAPEILSSTEAGGDNQNMSGYIQDNFEFLDQMDCSAPDHIDCSVSYQVNEFSVEPPGHSDDEYETMAQAQTSPCPAESGSCLHPDSQTHTQNQSESNPHRPLSLDLHSRYTKSLSLPYMTSPVHGPEESFSEDEATGDDSDDNEYSSEEDESMFVKSLPADFFLNTISGYELETDGKETSVHDRVPVHHTQSSEERDCQSPKNEHLACTETAAGEREQVEVKDREDANGQEEKETIEEQDEDKVHQEGDQQENDTQSGATEEHLSITKDAESEKSLTSEVSTTCCAEFPLPPSEDIDEASTVASASRSCDGEDPTEGDREEGEDSMVCNDMEDMCQDSDENMREEALEGKADIKHDSSTEQDTAVCGTHKDIWEELEDIVSEVIEDEEKAQSEREGAAGQADMGKDEQDGEHAAKVSGEKMMEVDKEEAKKIEVRLEIEEEPMEMAEGEQASLEVQQEFKDETQRATDEKMASQDEAQVHDGGEVLLEGREQGADEELNTAPSEDKQFKEIGSDVKESSEKSDNTSTGPGVESKVIFSQHKIYQVKAVPVVPPKPQHCRITALTIRQQQQQQQRERRDADRGRDNTLRVPAEQDKVCTGETVKDGDLNDESTEILKERPRLRGDSWERERRRDRAEARNSPLSMCFDEAVAIATMRREKEKGREGEGEVEGLGK